MFIAALMSLSWSEPHSGHVHCLSESESLSFVYPQSEQGFRSLPTSSFRENLTIFSTRPFKDDSELTESYVRDFASPEAFHTFKIERFYGNPIVFTHKPKANLKNQSRRLAAICLWTRARWRFARYQPLDRYCLPESLFAERIALSPCL